MDELLFGEDTASVLRNFDSPCNSFIEKKTILSVREAIFSVNTDGDL